MDDTIYAPGPIKCRECRAELETIEKGHHTANCASGFIYGWPSYYIPEPQEGLEPFFSKPVEG